MEHINAVLRKPASTLLWSERPKEFFPNNFLVEKVGLQFHCAKHPAWLGRGDLLQVPWCKRFHGLVVVINLWSGFGCALYALLAAGNRVIALTTEHSDDGIDALLCEFPSAVHLKRVEDVHAKIASTFVAPMFCFCAKQPHNLSRLANNITNLPEIRYVFTQVVG